MSRFTRSALLAVSCLVAAPAAAQLKEGERPTAEQIKTGEAPAAPLPEELQVYRGLSNPMAATVPWTERAAADLAA